MVDSLWSMFVVLVVVVDPVGLAPIFFAITQNQTSEQRRRSALLGTALSALILLIFFLIGDALLDALNIGLPAFRIAGGLLLFLLSIDMVFARQSGLRSTTVREQAEAEHRPDVSVFPLAFPLIAGPGALTTVLLMASSWTALSEFAGMLALLVLVLGLVLTSLLTAPVIMRVLGETGANVISRLLGLILAALAVQFILDGVKSSFPQVM